MGTVLAFFIGLLFLLGVGGAVIFFHSRKLLREQKNYERGLKMVPLLIHLPPMSDDIDVGQRDERDVTEETISKAQILYNIIASTLQKGLKSKFYGQRHFAFEIVGTHGVVRFYAAVPVALLEVVQQAVVSAYPSARLEEVAEHNIFSPVGKISGTIGGELTLKENYAYPIATFTELKRDAMQSLLNAMSTLEKEDGAGIQILMRPTDGAWRKHAVTLAGKKRKGTEKKKGSALALSVLKQVAVAPVKPPDQKGDGHKAEEPHQMSGVEQALVDAIEEKTRYPAYEVAIRVIASSNISQRAQSILNNIVATFSLFDSPGKNGFKYTPAKDIESFVTAYILRFFPQEHNKNILNAVELATIFHFPDQQNIPTSQLERQSSKQVDGPRNVPEDGMLLGYNLFRGAKKKITLSPNDRRRHIYVIGQTGTGKSTFMENLALQDMLAGEGFAFIDPHGDTAEKLLAMVPRERTEDVIYFCPADMDYPLGLNLFEFHDPEQKDFLIQEAINMLYKLYDPTRMGIIGPRYEHMFRNAALALMADPEGATFIDIPKMFNDPQYVDQKLKHVTDNTVIDFWKREMPNSQRSNDSGEVISWFVSKFSAFLSNTMMRNIIGQTKSSFDMREIMDKKKILLVNLSKGRTGELNSKLLGMVFVMKFQAAAMSRASIPEEDRVDFSLYVDEFQNFSTDSFATILSEARKYHLNLIVANQFTTQLTDEIRDAVFGNVGSIISFRVGTNDAEFLAKQFAPVFDIDDLQRVPNFNTIVRMLIGGVPAQPFSMATLPPLGNPNKKLAEALKQLSAAKYGRPKASVETEIYARLKTKEVARPAAGASPYGAPAYGAARPPAPKPTGTGSFLDEWMVKRASPPAPSQSTFGRKPFSPPPAGTAASPVAIATPSGAPDIPAAPIGPSVSALQPQQPVVQATTPASTPNQSAVGSVQLTQPSAPAKDEDLNDPNNNREVSSIAEEIKQSLNGHKPATAEEPATAKDPSVKFAKAQPAHMPPEDLDPSDTIHIDQEGNLTQEAKDAEEAS